MNLVESFTVASKKNPSVPYDFCADFYKFPSYLRRAAIAEALGKVSSYRSNLARWEAADPASRGEPVMRGFTLRDGGTGESRD